MIAFYGFLVIIATASAVQDVCDKSDKLYDLNGLQAAQLMTYCLVDFVVDEVNSDHHDENENVPGYGADCDYQTLINLPNGKDDNDKLEFLLYCFVRETKRAGDDLPVSRDVIDQRIQSLATQFVNDFDEGSTCSAEELEETTFIEIADDLPAHINCLVQHMLQGLTDPENVGNFDFSLE